MKVIDKEKTYSLVDYLKKHHMYEDCCGLVKINNTEGLYCLYYDHIRDAGKTVKLDNPRYRDYKDHGYKGVCDDSQVLLAEVPIDQISQGQLTIYYSKEAFQKHCRDYQSYQTWLKERNTQRYTDIKNHNQQIDGKNMMHCIRLLRMAKEIALTGECIIRRHDFQELLDIRQGKVSLQKLIESTNDLIQEVEELFEKSNLPDKIDTRFTNMLLKNIRSSSIFIKYE